MQTADTESGASRRDSYVRHDNNGCILQRSFGTTGSLAATGRTTIQRWDSGRPELSHSVPLKWPRVQTVVHQTQPDRPVPLYFNRSKCPLLISAE